MCPVMAVPPEPQKAGEASPKGRGSSADQAKQKVSTSPEEPGPRSVPFLKAGAYSPYSGEAPSPMVEIHVIPC